MTLDRFRSVGDRLFEPVVDTAEAIGLTANGVSVIAFVLAVAASVLYLFAGGAFDAGGPVLYLAGAALVGVNGVLDAIDGTLARRRGTESAAGDLLDHVLDRYADIVIIAGLAGGVGRYALGLAAVTGVLMTSYLGTQAQAVGLERVYGGLVGRADRLVIVVLVTTVAAFLPGPLGGLTLVGWLLVFFAAVGHLTALQRFYHAFGALD
ncbi:MAG: CDP-alcohol phosphatidyltransferase family protein [Haloarculaceae archaeon]